MECFDSSVPVAYYCPEPQSVVAEMEILRSKLRHVSTLCEVEIASALSLRATGQNPRTDLSAGQARLLRRVEKNVSSFDTLFSPRLASGPVALEISARGFCPVALKIRTGQIDVATAKTVALRMQSDFAIGYFKSLPIIPRALNLARDWISQFSTTLRTLDAIQLATSHLNGRELVTADKNLAKSAGVLKVQCRLIF